MKTVKPGKFITSNIFKTILILVLAMLAAFALYELGMRNENIFLIGLLAVIICIIETKKFWHGFVISLLFVIAYNYLFIEPRYTLMVNDPNYYVSFGLFIIFAVIANTLTSRLQKQITIAERNEHIASKLYKIGGGFLNLSGAEQILFHGQRSLNELIGHDVVLIYGKPDGSDKAALYCYTESVHCGAGQVEFTDSKYEYFPLNSKSTTHGVVRLLGKLGTDEEKLADTVISQITIALDREHMTTLEEINKLKIEKEKLKSNLLRSISHDLRTPLTGIAGGADFLLSGLDELDRETMKTVLNDIGTDAAWLANMVENLLNMTRIQDGRLSIKKKNEVVDDIIGEAVAKMKKFRGKHELILKKPDELMLVPADAQLIIQVVVNLIDNAFKHTSEDSEICVSAYNSDGNVIIDVTDNGGGISTVNIDTIFESFFTSDYKHSDKKRGIGLGLSICKSIVEAHGGKITAENNSMGGATFKISLPEVKKDD